MAAQAQPRAGRIINLADQKPASQGDVLRHATALLGVDTPVAQRLDEAELSRAFTALGGILARG